MSEGAEGEPISRQEELERRLMRERVLRVILSQEARQRLTNVKMVKPQMARMVEDYVIQLASTGKVKKPLSDDELKGILASMQQPKREFKIRWG